MRGGAALAAGILLVLAPAAMAQVSVNPGALDSLTPRTHPQAPPRSAARSATARPAPPRPAPPTPAQKPGKAGVNQPSSDQGPSNQASSNQAGKPPTVPQIPPAILALPPAVAVPLAHPPPPPVVPVADDAPGAVSEVKGGVRITFGPDRADLNPATVAALREFADGAKATQTPINVYAYATGNAEDPSTPRRLSLARALAARAVLINEGIPSTRIYPRALGPAGGDADPNRVDVVAGVIAAQGAPSTPPPGAGTSAVAPAADAPHRPPP